MKRYARVLFVFLPVLAAGVACGQESKTVPLPKPRTTGGKPLLDALAERRTTRDFTTARLPQQMLSDLLWAADGINRPDGRRTAPTSHNTQQIDVYVTTAEGAYRYQAKGHALELVTAGDLRSTTGFQDFAGTAALNLVYVADLSRMGALPDEEKLLYSAASAGFIGQNVYLFCASEGLGAVIRAWIDYPALTKALKLRPGQRVMLAQTVGYPKK